MFEALFFPLVLFVVILAWRASVVWLRDCRQAKVTTRDRVKDPALFRERYHEEMQHALYSSLKPPAAKGFSSAVKDRRAYVASLKDPRR